MQQDRFESSEDPEWCSDKEVPEVGGMVNPLNRVNQADRKKWRRTKLNGSSMNVRCATSFFAQGPYLLEFTKVFSMSGLRPSIFGSTGRSASG